MWNKIKHYLYLIFIKYYGLFIVSLIALDLISKAIMKSILVEEGNTIALIPNLFEFQLVYNTGSFSGWLGSDFGHVILIIISFAGGIAIPYIIVKYREKFTKPMLYGLALCAAGDIGNLVDRCCYVGGKPRGVIDFLHFYIPSLKFDWPTFNVADICIVIGVFMFAIFYFIYDSKNEKAKKEEQQRIFEEAKKKSLEEKKEEEEKDGE